MIEVLYLSRDCHRVTVHKDHIVWDLVVRNLGKEIKTNTFYVLIVFDNLMLLMIINYSYLAFAECSYLFCAGGLAIFQSDAGTHLLAQPVILHSNHLGKQTIHYF